MALLLVTKTVHRTRIGRTENVEVTSALLDTVMKGFIQIIGMMCCRVS